MKKTKKSNIIIRLLSLSLTCLITINCLTVNVFAGFISSSDAYNYVRNWGNYSQNRGVLVIFPSSGFDADYHISGFKIPTPSNGDMSRDYIINTLSSLNAGAIGSNASYYFLYDAALATELNGYETGNFITESLSANGYTIPVSSWSIDSINRDSVRVTATLYSSNVIATYYRCETPSECYFEGGSSTAYWTMDIPFADPAPSSIATSLNQYSLVEGDTTSIGATVQPTNAYSRILTYSCSNTNVAKVDNYGTITAIAPGTATITITEKNSNVSTSVQVKVDSKKVEATGFSFSANSFEVAKGKTQTISYTIQPSNATETKINWTSSNTNVASVSNGVVTGKSAGTTTITGTLSNGISASCSVTVVVPPESINVNYSKSMNQGTSEQIQVTFKPSDTTYTNVSYKSSNSSIVSVDSNGYVKAVAPGTATITVMSEYNSRVKAECNITVIATKAESISLNKSSIELNKGDSSYLTYTIKPTGVDSSVSWTSNNTNIATVDANGNVYAKNAGTATITVTTDNGKSDSCKVTVKNPVTSIKLNKHSTTIAVGKTEKLSYTITPSDADNKSVKWSSSDTSAVTVDSNGTIKGIKANSSATITVTSANNISDSITVTVEAAKPTSISFSESNKTMYVGDTLTLKPTILPAEAASDKLAWSTTNSYVVSVSGGVLTAKKEGTAKITVRTTSDKIATCQITVKAVEPTSVSINNTKATIKIGDTITLTSTVNPKNASQNVTWSSSNTNIATVSNGIVTAKAVGSATITVKTSNGKTATCNVTVTPIEVTSIALNKTSATLKVGENTSLSVTYTPSNATTKSVTWTSDNNSIATVSNGVVTAKSVGSAVITAKTSNGKTATCKVTVNPIDVTSISLNETEKTIEQGKTATIYATVSPSNATVKTIKWSSSNTSVATIDTNGKITAKSAGSTTITATSNNGKTATCKIIVPEVAVTSISLSKTSASINIGDTVALTATINPENAANKSIIWAVDDKSIATVDNNGNVKAVGVGKTIVTAKTSNGKTAACTITVIDTSNLKVNFTERMQYVELGSSYQLKFDALPEGTVVKFESSNEDAVTVDNNGIVTAHQMKQVIVAATIGNNESVVYVQVTSNREIREAARKQFAEEILYYVNIERKKAGVAPLELMDDLSYLAQIRTNEQVQEYKNNKAKYRTEPFISHTRPNGTPWSTVFEYASIKKKAAAENLIQGAGFTAETCVNRWMNSPGHRANILRANLTHMGIGVEFTNINPDGGSASLCVTQLFIEKR